MKKLKIKIQKALNRDVIVCVRQVEHKMGLFRSIFVDETSYQELITLQRTLITDIADSRKRQPQPNAWPLRHYCALL